MSKDKIEWCLNWCKQNKKDSSTDYEWELANTEYNKIEKEEDNF
jgi:hypothetical protein